ncbi:MAG: YhfC family intramembrane metalloprotease [Lachnoclostridium sp.]|jgi:uncharacterized membrane protein YhfC|nr:YhfC family intramembrane metalloprotease [Lachnoclostridium sp.]
METIFSNAIIWILILSAALCIAGPILLLFYFRRKHSAAVSPFFWGMVGYLVCGRILYQLLAGSLFSFLPSVSSIPWQSSFYGALLSALTAGAARFVMLKYVMKNRLTAGNALMYGAGQGGFYAMIYGTTLCLTNAVTMLFNNSLGTKTFLEKLGYQGEELNAAVKNIQELHEIPITQYLFDGIAPFLIFLTEAALSIFMFVFITKKTAGFLLPVSFILHFIVLLSYNFEKENIITNPLAALTAILCITAFCLLYAGKLRSFFPSS